MQKMMETKGAEHAPGHMKMQSTEKVDIKKLRELVDQLPEGTILSVNLEEVADGQEDS